MSKRLAAVVIVGVTLIALAAWCFQIEPASSFRHKFSALVIAVEVDGRKLNVVPYRISDRASIRAGSVYSLMKNGAKQGSTIVFHMENGEHVDCYCGWEDGEFRFAPRDGNAVYGGYGVGVDLWPDEQGDQSKVR
jgi:hypothetical protein